MLRITIELVPYGIEDEAQPIARMLVANDGTGNVKFGNYGYAYEYLDREGIDFGILTRFPRNGGAWELVRKVLNDKYHAAGNELTDLLTERLNYYRQLDEEMDK